jgi:hypothetical protein
MRGAAHQRITILKLYNMKTASKIIRYIIAAVILYAVLSYCQEINDCLMKY